MTDDEIREGLEAAHKATKQAFANVDRLHPELDPWEDSMIRQKLIETELGIYDPIGEEWKDPRFLAAFKRREIPHGAHCDGCHGLDMGKTQ